MKYIFIILLGLISSHSLGQSLEWINRIMPNQGEHEEVNARLHFAT